jgi:hypothetical protein
MTRNLAIVIAWVLCLATPAFAQNPIPNPGFETWSDGNPVGWMTSNGYIPGSITQTALAHSGSSAVRGDVLEVTPGFNGQPMIQTGESGEGFPTHDRPGALDLFYKLTPVGGDRILMAIIFTKDGTVLGGGSTSIDAAASTYTEFMMPIFFSLPDIPDSAYFYTYMIGPPGQEGMLHLGSWFAMDDLSFEAAQPPVCPITLTGDVNNSGDRVTSDIIYLVNYVLKGGAAPIPCVAVGDANCDGQVATSDIIYLVNSILKGGPAPCDVCSIIPGTWSCP